VAAVLSGLALSALWVMPPFWVPYAYGLALVLVVGGHLRAGRLSFRGIWKTPAWNAVLVTLVVGLGLFGGYLSLQSAKGRVLPEGEVVHIAAPFGPGHYLVAHGGGTQTVNGAQVGDNGSLTVDIAQFFGSAQTNVDAFEVRFQGSGGLDRIVFDPPGTDVPEPATLALVGTGLLAAGALTRRRRRV